jgi:hypothetical protein
MGLRRVDVILNNAVENWIQLPNISEFCYMKPVALFVLSFNLTQQWLGNKQVVLPIYDHQVDTPSVGFLQTWVDE